MFISNFNYYLYIDNSKSFNLNLIKIRDKFSIIYRNNNPENIIDLKLLKKTCDRKGIKLLKLMIKLKHSLKGLK